MARITAGVACSHVPAIGAAIDDPYYYDPYYYKVGPAEYEEPF